MLTTPIGEILSAPTPLAPSGTSSANLQSGTTYVYEVRIDDSLGNEASSTVSFKAP